MGIDVLSGERINWSIGPTKTKAKAEGEAGLPDAIMNGIEALQYLNNGNGYVSKPIINVLLEDKE